MPDDAVTTLSARTAARLLALVIAVGVVARLYRFGAPILDQHAFRQTQTASTVWLWNRDGLDVLDYRVPAFGGGHWVLELPVYQLAVWVLQAPAGGIEHAARVVSIASYVATAVLMYLIGRRWLASRAAALLGVTVFSLLPVTVFYFRSVLIDTLLIATTLLTVYAAMRLGDAFTWRWFAVFSAALVLSALGKATLVPAIGLAIAVPLWRIARDRGVGVRPKAALVATILLTGLLSLAWVAHGNTLNQASGSLSIAEGRAWFFGSTFTDPALYRAVGGRFLDNFGVVGLVLIGLGLAALPSLLRRGRPELAVTLVGAAASVGIFANLNRIHDYYQLAYYVPLSMLAGLGLRDAGRALAGPAGTALAAAGVAALVAVLAVTSALSLRDGYFAPEAVAYPVRDQSRELRARTPDARVVVIQQFIDPSESTLLYEARRTGWGVSSGDPGGAAAIVEGHPDIGALVWIGPSPEPPFIAELARAGGYDRTVTGGGMTVHRREGRGAG